ncbi:MAG: hypothetical protein JWM42_3668 [Burkholderia sp.]|nr:hypothetical protein [Burkholderia sp.]
MNKENIDQSGSDAQQVSHAPERTYRSIGFETRKFDQRREPYWQGVQEIIGMDYDPVDLIHHFPAFTGHVCLGRFLALYEVYKQTLGLMGHIAEAGVWKGSSLLMFAKLTQLFEPEALTQVHGFDWFRGNHPEEAEKHLVSENSYFESKERLEALIRAQRLDNVALLHELDLSKDLDAFFSKYAHLQFKLVFLDCGLYPVVRHCIEYFWERLTPGGILLLDNINHETAPGETLAVREMLPGMRIRTFPFTQQPTGYIVKPAQDAL